MDLFSNFSFGAPSSRHMSSVEDIDPIHEISPFSSRSVSPIPSRLSPASMSESSVAELSAQFSRHNLRPRDRPAHRSSHAPSRGHTTERRRANTTAQDYMDAVRLRRQSATNRQCDPCRLANIKVLINQILRESEGYMSERHPSSISRGYRQSVTSSPSSYSVPDDNHTCSMDALEDSDSDSAGSLTPSNGASGHDRHFEASRAWRMRPNAVEKASRLRRKPHGKGP